MAEAIIVIPEIQFVNITKPGLGWKNRNEHLVRSHAMKHVRRRQKKSTLEQSRRMNETLTNPAPAKAAQTSPNDKIPLSWCAPRQVHMSYLTDDVTSQSYVDRVSPYDSTKWPLSEQKRSCTPHGGGLQHQPAWHTLSHTETRLLLHISSLYLPLSSGISDRFVMWTSGIETLES
jgi:hypothetical protein